MSARISGQQIHFLSLQTAIFCVQCELISANTTPCCIACGSRAVLGLSRLLGGSLRTKPAARLIEDDELNQLVRDLLCTVPSQQTAIDLFLSPANVPTRDHARTFSSEAGGVSASTFSISKIDLEPAIGVITERAQSLTRATGAAIALKKGNEVICRARAGRTAPDIGVRLQTDSGVSAECLRKGEVVLCNDAEETIRRWTWQLAAAWECAPSWRHRSASFKGPWEYSRYSPQPRTPSIIRMSPPCNSFPA